jgi:hypothetical protein
MTGGFGKKSNEVRDMDGDGAFNLHDIAEQLKANKNNEWTPLEGDGDFRSPECVELLKQSDICQVPISSITLSLTPVCLS